MKTLIERISYLLELVGNSQAELAKIAGVTPTSVNDWLLRRIPFGAHCNLAESGNQTDGRMPRRPLGEQLPQAG